MNIDIEIIGLLSLILQDSPKDRLLILCVLVRSNSVPARITFNPSTDYPTFYGYSNSKIPYYLMGKGILSNVPREGSAKRLLSSHYLSHAETIINRANNWDIHNKLFSISRFIKLDNKTPYKDAEVFLVFKDKALDYIKGYGTSAEPEYQEVMGNKPPAPIRTKLSRKSLEKIWTVLQEIEDKRGITPSQDDISIPLVHFSKVKDDIGANNFSDERRNILRKLENEENAIKDVRLPDKLREYVYLKIGDRYFEVFDYYEKEYKSAAKNYQQEQQASQHTDSLKDQYKQLLKEIKEPSKPTLAMRYDKTIKDIQLNQQPIKSQTVPKVNENGSFSLTENVLSVNEKPIKFKKDARTLALLRLLVKKSKGIYYSEEAKKLEGAIPDNKKEPKNTYYEVCRGIENRLAKIGITDFLQYDYNQAKINPHYKNSSK